MWQCGEIERKHYLTIRQEPGTKVKRKALKGRKRGRANSYVGR